MTVEIRTTGVKPLRNTFEHIEKRFGDKPATRYQEASYDVQPTTNFHYKPLWDPEHDMYDVRRTAVVMEDWYALKDPRQYYYGNYTMTRAKQQDAQDKQLEFVGSKDLLRILPEEARQQIIRIVLPLRHYEFGANMNCAHMAAYGYGTIFTQAAMMASADRLGMAQHLSRIGLLLDGNTGESLEAAKSFWVDADIWQGLRREMENLFVVKDPFHSFVLQFACADSLVYPLVFEHFDARFAKQNGSALSSLNDFLVRWRKENDRWVDSCLKIAIKESDANKTLISGWLKQGHEDWKAALLPLATDAFGEAAAEVLDGISGEYLERMKKLGAEFEVA